LGAGYETTATALCFASLYLALNPNFYQKLQQEIDSTFGQDINIDYEKLMKIQYLDLYVKEIIRIKFSVNRSVLYQKSLN